MNTAERNWTTVDEIAYLNNISHWSDDRADRHQLLLNYRRMLGFRPRSEGHLNFNRLRERVEELLMEAER